MSTENEDNEQTGDILARAIRRVADSIDGNGAPGPDASGGYVGCVTEAVMGVTSGLFEIAAAINDLAEAIREGRESQ